MQNTFWQVSGSTYEVTHCYFDLKPEVDGLWDSFGLKNDKIALQKQMPGKIKQRFVMLSSSSSRLNKVILMYVPQGRL